jgi:sensor domain CHASE-containing protein
MNDAAHRQHRTAVRLRQTLGVTFAIALLVFAGLGAGVLRGDSESRRAAAADSANVYAQRIGHRLQETMGAVYMLASLVQQGRGRVDNFEAVATSIIEIFPMVSSLQLAPNGVIDRVFPLPGNESVLGTDLLNVGSIRRHEAHEAIIRRQLVVGGPYPLTQGGVGAIGRYPIFLTDPNGWSKFWGFAIVVVRIPLLFDAVRIGELADEGYRYEICRMKDDDSCEVFMRHGNGVPVAPVEVGIEVPNGRWYLRLAPEEGWYPAGRWVVLAVASIVLAALVTFAQYLLLKRLSR